MKSREIGGMNLSKEDQEEIRTGLDQADKGNFTANDIVMKRFVKWRL